MSLKTPPPPARVAVAGPQPAAKRAGPPAWRIDPRYLAPIFVTIILLTAHFSVGVLESPAKMALAVGTAILLEMALGRLMYGRIPHLASAYVSGNSVAILMRSPF